MSILSADDLLRMAATITAIRGDNETTIQIRRDNGTPPGPQTVRVERRNSISTDRQDGHSEETMTDVVILGDTTLDMAKEDRFTWQGDLYRVKFVRPNRQVCTQAEAEVIQ